MTHGVWWTLGGLLGLVGVALFAWALVGDRSRGRRRCPGRVLRACWYDMSGTQGLVCPECGRVARAERELHRSRVRRWWAAGGVLLVVLGAGAAVQPMLAGGGWKAWVPDRVLLLLAPHVRDDWVMNEISARWNHTEGDWNVSWRNVEPGREALWPEVARVCCRVMGNADLPTPARGSAMNLLLQYAPGPEPLPALPLECLRDPDPMMAGAFASGLKTSRFRLGAQRDAALAALRARVPDGSATDERFEQAIENLTRDASLSAEELSLPPPDPDEFVALATGAGTRGIAAPYARLGLHPRAFTVSWYGDAGPCEAVAQDVQFDAGGPDWRAVLVRPRPGPSHLGVLLWRREGSRWRFVRDFQVTNQNGTVSLTREGAGVVGDVESKRNGGRQWLVICHQLETDGPRASYRCEGETWLRVAPGGAVVASSMPVGGSRLPAGSCLGWRMRTGPARFASDGGIERVERDYVLTFVPKWSSGWNAGPPGVDELEGTTLAERSGVVSWQVEASGRLVFEPARSTFPQRWVEQSLWADIQLLVPELQSELLKAAAEEGTPAMRAWLWNATGELADVELREQIRARLLGR